MTIYTGDWLCPGASEPVAGGAIAVENGRIVHVGRADDIQGTDRVHYPGCAIIPGFVNAHAHLELTILRGFLENLPFIDWIRKLTQIKYQRLDSAALALSARLGAMDMLRAGVTCVGEVMDIGAGWEALREAGLQGVAYQEVFGPAQSVAAGSFTGLQRKVEHLLDQQSETLRIGISPHAPYTVSNSLYEMVRDYARSRSLPMTAHIAESRDETSFVRDGSGPFADALRRRDIDVIARDLSPLAYLDSLSLLGMDMLAIHAIEANADDIERLAETQTFVVHCPKSNAKLGHGTARISEMLAQGICVGLGTDSVASNNCIDMFEEMRAAIFQQRTLLGRIEALTAKEAFRMATLDGARCLGLEKQLGSLEVGKRADFALVDLGKAATQPVYDPVETMVYSACRGDIRATFIGGKEMICDDSDMLREVQSISRTLKG